EYGLSKAGDTESFEEVKQKKRRPEGHEQKLKRGRIFFGIQKENDSLRDRVLEVKVARGDSTGKCRGIARQIRDSKHDEGQGKGDAQSKQPTPPVGRLQQAAEAVSKGHDGEPGNERK